MRRYLHYALTAALLTGLASALGDEPSTPGTPYRFPAKVPTEETLVGPGDRTISKRGSWPHFRGPEYNGISAEKKLISSFPPEGPRVVWERTLLGGYSSVVIEAGKLLTMSRRSHDEVVQAFDVQTGEKIWEAGYPRNYLEHFGKDSTFLTFAPTGPRATPAISEGRVYTIGATGTVSCLDLENGNLIWRKELLELAGETMAPPFGYCSSPLVVGENLYVQPGVQHPEKHGTSLAALNKNTGELRWRDGDHPYSYATPLPIKQGGSTQILFFTGSGPVAMTPEGKGLWHYPWATHQNQNTASPIFAEDKLFLSSAYDRGATLLQLSADKAPQEIWKTNRFKNHFSSSVLYQGHLYGFSETRLRCLDWKTGEIRWDKPGLGRGNVIAADDKLIILSADGELVLAKASPDKFEELGRHQIFEENSWTVPVLLDGILYVRNEWHLKALDFRQP